MTYQERLLAEAKRLERRAKLDRLAIQAMSEELRDRKHFEPLPLRTAEVVEAEVRALDTAFERNALRQRGNPRLALEKRDNVIQFRGRP